MHNPHLSLCLALSALLPALLCKLLLLLLRPSSPILRERGESEEDYARIMRGSLMMDSPDACEQSEACVMNVILAGK